MPCQICVWSPLRPYGGISFLSFCKGTRFGCTFSWFMPTYHLAYNAESFRKPVRAPRATFSALTHVLVISVISLMCSVTQLCPALCRTVSRQAHQSMEISRQEWRRNGQPCPSAADLPDPGIKPRSLASPALAGGLFTTMPPNTFSVIPLVTLLSICLPFPHTKQ